MESIDEHQEQSIDYEEDDQLLPQQTVRIKSSILSASYDDQLLRLPTVGMKSSILSASYDDNDEIPPHLRMPITPMATKIERIKSGTSKQQRAKRKKIKNINSCKDLWRWYWQNPIGHLPVLYFFACFLSSFFFSIFWFMDNDTSFILCGIIVLSMTSYAMYKFKISMNLKREIDKYKQLNIKFQLENKYFTEQVKRAIAAHKMLKSTRRRLQAANNKNRENLLKFEQIEENMKIAGEKAIKGMGNVHKQAIVIRSRWREHYLTNEREMLQAVYTRFERHHTNRTDLGMNKDDFDAFQSLLPRRYSTRFRKMGTFRTLAGDKTIIDYRQFADALDLFAEMDVDQKDIAITPRRISQQIDE